MLWNMCSFGWVSFLFRFRLIGGELFSHLIVSLLMRFIVIHNSIHWKKGLVMCWEKLHLALDALEKKPSHPSWKISDLIF